MSGKFFRRIGKPSKEELPNTWLSCALLCVMALFLALAFGMRAAKMADTTLRKESFVLESAEHYSNKRRRSDTHTLRLKGANGESYEVEDSLISEQEIEAALEKLLPGETVDVLLNGYGIVMQLSCGGEDLLDPEKVLRRVKYNVYGVSGLSAFMGLSGAYLCLRTASLGTGAIRMHRSRKRKPL